jgi:hypothetical protein
VRRGKWRLRDADRERVEGVAKKGFRVNDRKGRRKGEKEKARGG